MIKLKNSSELARIREASYIVAESFNGLKTYIQAGVTTIELDKFARDLIERKGARPAFLGYMKYPASICVSINNEVIHGIPSKRKLKDGDIVGIDLGVDLKGYYGDAAVTYTVGKISRERRELVRVTEECLYIGIEQAVAGNRIKDISRVIEQHAKKYKMELVRQYCGHGVGFSLHEEPQVPNYVSTGPNPRLKPGMVLAIEPMVNRGTWEIKILEDDWTVVTADGKDSAHFEHTVAILKDRTEILTSLNGTNEV